MHGVSADTYLAFPGRRGKKMSGERGLRSKPRRPRGGRCALILLCTCHAPGTNIPAQGSLWHCWKACTGCFVDFCHREDLGLVHTYPGIFENEPGYRPHVDVDADCFKYREKNSFFRKYPCMPGLHQSLVYLISSKQDARTRSFLDSCLFLRFFYGAQRKSYIWVHIVWKIFKNRTTQCSQRLLKCTRTYRNRTKQTYRKKSHKESKANRAWVSHGLTAVTLSQESSTAAGQPQRRGEGTGKVGEQSALQFGPRLLVTLFGSNQEPGDELERLKFSLGEQLLRAQAAAEHSVCNVMFHAVRTTYYYVHTETYEKAIS